jgi:hypothetical protein
VVLLEIPVERQAALAQGRMTTPHHHRRSVGTDPLASHAVGQRQGDIDGEAHRAGAERAFDVAAADLHRAQVDAMTGAGDAAHDGGQHQCLGRVAQADGELRFRRRGIEAAGAGDEAVQRLEALAQRSHQLARERRRHQRAALPGEERVAEHLAQARQRMADRRLAEVQPLRRARDAALA